MQYGKTGRRMLVVDDNPVNRVVIRHQLRRLGHDVDVVENGRQALAVLGREHYDLILMDCQMPVLDGYEATRRLRLAGNPLPVIACTAQAVSQVREECLAAGMNDVLPKPIATHRLGSLLDVWLPEETARPLSSAES